MKKFILLLLFPFSVFSGYIPENYIGKDTAGIQSFVKKPTCETYYSTTCVFFQKNLEYHELNENKEIVINPTKKAAYDKKISDAAAAKQADEAEKVALKKMVQQIQNSNWSDLHKRLHLMQLKNLR